MNLRTQPCLNCSKPRSSSFETGPDGYRTLCSSCARKYAHKSLPVYAAAFGAYSIAPTRAGQRPLKVLGFESNDRGTRNLTAPLTALDKAGHCSSTYARPVSRRRPTSFNHGKQVKQMAATDGRKKVLQAWEQLRFTDEACEDETDGEVSDAEQQVAEAIKYGYYGRRAHRRTPNNPRDLLRAVQRDSVSAKLLRRANEERPFSTRRRDSSTTSRPFVATQGPRPLPELGRVRGQFQEQLDRARGKRRHHERYDGLYDRESAELGERVKRARVEQNVMSFKNREKKEDSIPHKREKVGHSFSKLSVKATLRARGSNVTRRFSMLSGLPYSSFKRSVLEIFGARESFMLRYKDDFGDFVTITSDNEVAELYKIVVKAGLDPLIVELL